MKPISNDFKNTLKTIKQIDAIVSYADRDNTNFIITQNSEFLITQVQDFLVTQSAEIVIDNNGIQNIAIYWNADLLKSVCKMLDLETSSAIPKGTELIVRVGLLVGQNYEYVNYGKFYTVEEPKYNLDTNSYTTTAYDKMINFNIKAIENPLTFEEGVVYTLKQYLEMICNKCGVLYSFDFTNLVNANAQIIDKDPYDTNKEVTYRDILNDIAECLGTNFIINENNRITNKELDLTSNITIDDDILKNTNVYIGEKKETIDGVEVYDGSTMIAYSGGNNSVFKIKNNNIMSAHNSVLLSNVLDMIEDFSYYAYQLETFGILALEPFDCFTVSYKNTNYLLCSMHNDIRVSSGLSEEISYEFKEEDATIDYQTTSDEDKMRDAFIEIDKANSQIVLKVDSDGNVVEAKLKADADEGSAFEVKADNINFNGKTFNLTSENIKINSTNFQVDESGNIKANNGEFTGSIKAGSSLSLTAEDGTYTTFKVARQSDNNTYCGINGQSMVFWKNNIRRIYISDILSSALINVMSDDGATGATFSSVGSSNTSDIRYKENIKNIDKEKSLEFITELNPIEFTYKNSEQYHRGLSAQEVEKSLNKIGVKNEIYSINEKDGKYMLYYTELIPDLINCIKIQQDQIDELKKEIKSLKGE